MLNIVCVKKVDLFTKIASSNIINGVIANHEAFFGLPLTMKQHARSVYDDVMLQIIPFITLINRETQEVLIYRHADASLPCSIGLDTYLEEEHASATLESMIARQSAELLRHELGLTNHQELRKVFAQNIVDGNCGILYHDKDHLLSQRVAVSFMAFVDPKDITLTNHNVLSRGQWMKVEDMENALRNKLITLNPWSLSVLEVLQVLV